MRNTCAAANRSRHEMENNIYVKFVASFSDLRFDQGTQIIKSIFDDVTCLCILAQRINVNIVSTNCYSIKIAIIHFWHDLDGTH
jgi:hypothetical protein